MIDWYIGTMGFSYKDWEGVFYPSEVPNRNYLSYYSRVFDAVEVDSTFYGTPRAASVLRWAEITPDNFKFSVKVPRIVTHDLNLVNAWAPMDEFLRRMSLLEKKLGVILLQFPPSFTLAYFQNLENFLSELPSDLRFAVEVRDASWYTAHSQIEEMLSKNNIAWAATEYPGLPREIHRTADFVYIRWIGQHGSFSRHDQERIDRTPELSVWWKLLQENLEGEEEVFGFMNNDFAGFAPATANRFKEIAGLSTKPLLRPRQQRLF